MPITWTLTTPVPGAFATLLGQLKTAVATTIGTSFQ